MFKHGVASLVYAVNSLRFLLRKDKAAECFTELFSTGSLVHRKTVLDVNLSLSAVVHAYVSHSAETWAIPVDLSGLLVECTFLRGLFLCGCWIERCSFFALL